MQFPDGWSVKQQMEALQRWICVQSAIYYVYNENVVSDFTYDANTRQLLDLRKQSEQLFTRTRYYEYFSDFFSGTSFNVVHKIKGKDPELYMRILQDATMAIKLKKGGKK